MCCVSRVIISIILAGLATTALAVDLDSACVARMKAGIALSITEEFDSAQALFEPIVAHDSTDYNAYFMLAAILHSKMMDSEDFALADSFEVLLAAAERQAQSAIDSGNDPAWALFIQGSVRAYRAALEGHTGSWFSAMKEGVKGKNRCLDALRIDPGLYDTYVVLGNYHYWKSARTEFINWLPLVADRKEQGIEELHTAIDSSLISGDLALNSLVWVLIDAERYDDALAAAGRIHDRYPDSRLANWAMAFASLHAGRVYDATTYFEEIISQLEADSSQNYFNLIECRYQLAAISLAVADTAAAIEQLTSIKAYSPSEEVSKRQKDKLKETDKLLKKLAPKPATSN